MYFLSQRKIKIDNSVFGHFSQNRNREIVYFRMRINGRGNKNCGFR